jgi:hypothetical protein
MLTRTFSNISKTVFTLAFVLGAQFASADVSGKWAFAVDVMGQTGNAAVTIEQTSEASISGNYAGQLGTSEFTGTTDGTQMSFTLVNDLGSVTYKGALQDNGSITGSVDFAGMAEGTFVATKAN